MGDTSDNYPGVRGIGEAVKLIQEYESVEGILANLDSLTKGVRTKIEADLEIASVGLWPKSIARFPWSANGSVPLKRGSRTCINQTGGA